MYKLLLLELKRNSLKPYHVAAAIITVVMLSFLYLFAAIPKIDPTDTDLGLFMSYGNLIGLNNILCMVTFSILSGVMSAKFIVEEYVGNRTILLFSYPIDRKKMLGAKIFMVFSYTVISMLLCGTVVLGIFLTTETFAPLCSEKLSIFTVFKGFFSLLCYSLLSGALGTISLWFGFLKKSTSTTIVASVIISTITCQIMTVTFAFIPVVLGVLAFAFIITAFAWKDLFRQVEKMEV